VIAEYAFECSVYPLIVRVAVHLALDEQRALALQLRQHLGDALFVPDDEPDENPSPELYKNKILIAVRSSHAIHSGRSRSGCRRRKRRAR